MGFDNPPVRWKELEARLSGRARQGGRGDGNDAPAWSAKRPPYTPPAALSAPRPRPVGAVAYAELHCHSNFSFLDGASHPEELVEEATRLGLEALALTDHDGLYGVVRFAEAAREVGMPTIFGAEVTLDLPAAQVGVADPAGTHVVVLARDPVGYTRLARALSVAHLRGGEKGRPTLDLASLAAIGSGAVPDLTAPGDPLPAGAGRADHWAVLTGCRKGAVPAALLRAGPGRAAAELGRLQAAFGRDNVVVELWDHGDPLDSARNDALVALADRAGATLVATNNAHYHRPDRRRLAAALAAVRARRSLDDMDGWLPAAGAAHLRSGAEQARRFARYPGVVEAAAALGRACAFDLALVAPRLPPYPTPGGESEMAYLRRLAEAGARHRYGPREAPEHPAAWAQIDHELAVIEALGFPGYFLIVWDIVEFCRTHDIYCQGRGSAANSAVCYALGITKADAVRLGLLFERFLSPERDGPPDIDVDIESGRREEVIQYVYGRYGRGCAAQVANVITYRPRSSVRDMGKALGASTGQLDAWSKQIDAWGPLEATVDHDIPAPVLELAHEVAHFPRHLGIHSGGMVLCDRPVAEVCPVEWARMPGRSVLQWDKDDCAATGLVKFDLLGLGMLTVLHATVDHVAAFHGDTVDLAALPQEDAVYEMLSRADSVGVFQVESRAQMATLPRLRPREFYDLVVEVALIRPGPIQGGSVHPYIRRRNGQEPVTYLHPLLERSLAKTLGVPLFQEQLMQMAIDVAGFTPAEADQLRQAMGSKRSVERMERLEARLYAGMAERGITGGVADEVYDKLVAFANFGFPESHSVSFAYLVYSSAWLKLHYPAAFTAGLLDGQPMGFWSPQTIVADARRHGVVVRGPDVNASGVRSRLEPAAVPDAAGSGVPQPAVRLGLSSVRHVGDDVAARIEAAQPFAGVEDLVRRSGLSVPQAEALATAGALGCFGLQRREALWAAGAAAQAGADLAVAVGGDARHRMRSARLPGLVTGAEAPTLPGMTPAEANRADLWATGLSPDHYPTEFVRDALTRAGVVTAAGLAGVAHGDRVRVAGVVTHRQRPATAAGITFLNLEDETGLVNIVCHQGVWSRYRRVARAASALVVGGRLERVDGVVAVLAERIEALALGAALRSRDFR
ncbi:MAG TPA: error-prone DNA polymerase [Acidimicrobiales bacterium]|nr:error-prone DNA polymerase [Acidimicrobiales bacterium]